MKCDKLICIIFIITIAILLGYFIKKNHGFVKNGFVKNYKYNSCNGILSNSTELVSNIPFGESSHLKQFSTFDSNIALFNTPSSSFYKKEPYVFLKHSVKEGTTTGGTDWTPDIEDDIYNSLFQSKGAKDKKTLGCEATKNKLKGVVAEGPPQPLPPLPPPPPPPLPSPPLAPQPIEYTGDAPDKAASDAKAPVPALKPEDTIAGKTPFEVDGGTWNPAVRMCGETGTANDWCQREDATAADIGNFREKCKPWCKQIRHPVSEAPGKQHFEIGGGNWNPAARICESAEASWCTRSDATAANIGNFREKCKSWCIQIGHPVPDVSPPKEFPLAQTDTWDEASAKCNGEGKKLCTKDQICKNDEPVFYGKTADTWTPIAEKDDWLQIGTHDTRLCETHPGGPPGWGTVKTMKGFRNTLICCD